MKRFFCVYSFLLYSLVSIGQSGVINTIPSLSVEEYKLEPLNKINTLKSEFGAVAYENGIVFVSEQKADLVNFESIDADGNPYLYIFFSFLKNGAFS